MSDRRTSPAEAIAVIGMSGRFPDAPDVDTLWRNLCERRESIARFSEAELLASGVAPELIRAPNYVPAAAVLADIEQFDAEFFHFSPREAECTDPQHRVLLECAWEALERAGYVGERFDGRIAVYVGSGPSSYWLKNLANNPHVASSLFEEQSLIGNVQDYAATRISYKLNLTGPSLSVGTACSTSLVAVHLACQSLLDFHCDIALAGGVSIRVPSRAGYLYYEGGINSPDGHCRPFDSAAQGTLTGSGAGIVALRRLEDAIEARDTIWAVILGTAANNDGSDKIGFTAPSELGQSAVIAEALTIAGVSPDTITLLEAHGTATPLGDPIEVAALTRVFRRSTERRQFCALGSIKANMGHLDEAAGVAGLIKVVLALRHRLLPPSLHFDHPNPKLELEKSPFFVNTTLREWVSDGPRRAGVSSFGIGGTNAHALLEEATLPPPTDPITRPLVLLTLSARTRNALDTLARNLAAHLEHCPEISLADVAFTLAVGRREFSERSAIVCASSAEAVAQLRSGAPLTTTVASERPARGAVFLFPGQGSQYAGMGRGLYSDEPAFRAAVDTCARILEERCGLDLIAALFPSADTAASLDETNLAQPALFSIEYAIATLLRSWGIEPAAMAGHSLGEYVAATIAGVFTLEDALTLVAARSRLMHSTPRGCMLAVPMPAAELEAYLADGRISLAALNAPASTVLAGPPDAIAAVEANLAGRGSIRLRTSRAFHSPLMNPILSEFEALVRKTRLCEPRIRFISNVSGEWITPAQAIDPAYWVRHIREPVRFVDGVRELLTVPDTAWIEAGPGNVLANLVNQHTNRSANLRVSPTLPSSRSKLQDSAVMLGTLGELWATGLSVDWAAFFKLERRRRVPLPTYPFERRRFWVDAPQSVLRTDGHEALGETMPASSSSIDSWFYTPRWRQLSKSGSGAFAEGAWVIFDDGEGLAPALASLLRQAEARSVVVRDNQAWSWGSDEELALPLQDAAMHARLWRELGAPWERASILYFAGARPSALDGRTSHDHDPLLGLLALIQGLGASPGMRRLVVVTNGTQAVLEGHEVSNPEHATLWGAMRVIAKEYPNLQCSTIDLDTIGDRSLKATAADVLTALAEQDVAALALRKGRVWEQHLEPALLPPLGPSRIRERGVYLITGGLGSMGLAFAEHLSRTARARLALVSRSGLNNAAERPGGHACVSRFPLLKRVEAIEEIERTAHRTVDVATLASEPDLKPLLDSLCASLVWQYLAPGFDSVPGRRVRQDDARTRLGILPKFRTFFERLLRLLAEDGIIRLHEEEDELEPLIASFASPDLVAAELAARFPQFVPLADLIRHCVGHYPDALSGRVPAVTVLYPDGTSQWLDAAMANIPNYSSDHTYLRATADLIAQLARGRTDGPLRILEVGGGSGTLTVQLAELIASGNVDYHFTDISPTFVSRVRELAAERGLPGMRFGRFDISRPAGPQGLQLHSYDVVLGYNVVHATPDLVETTRILNSLLKEGGGLLLVEAVQPPRWVDLIWGLSDGWWSFTDRHRRLDSPLVSLQAWERILLEAGFTRATAYPRAAEARRRTDAGLIIGEASGEAPLHSEHHARVRERIRRMEADGAEVCVLAADVSISEELDHAVAAAEARFGPIQGVIHTAGVLGQTLVHQQSAAELRRVLAPKVHGTLHLAAALEDRPLDFFVLCGSMSALIPIAGQFDYSAANAFLDAFAHARASRRPGLTVAIDWGFWQELGMIETARVSEEAKQAARDEIAVEKWHGRGVEILARILGSGDIPAQLLVSPRLPESVTSADFGASEILSHPILSGCVMRDTKCALFEGSISSGNAWFVDEHRVADTRVLPGTAYVDMAVAAFWHCHGFGPVELKDVYFLVPMVFVEGERREVRLLLERVVDHWCFRIVAQTSSSRWQEHARGKIQALVPDAGRETIDIAVVEARLATEGGAQTPKGFWDRVNSFMPHWRNITDAVFGLAEAAARFELAPEVCGDVSRFALHPALLDTATGFMAFRPDLEEFVPFHFGCVRVFDQLPAQCRSVFRILAEGVLAGSVLDLTGQELVRIEEYTFRRAPSASIAPARTPTQNAQLEIGVPGQLETLAYRPGPRRWPRDGEVEIEVRAAGLNFIEVLYALGMLPNLAGGPVVFGQECAGIVTAVGKGVDFQPGAEVIAYGRACFSLFTTLDATAVALKPAWLSFEEAAGLPAAFITAWHSLAQLAQLRPGERVLIHAAAGGVGLAAVRIARWRGAEIFATAGSEEKRRFLRGLGVSHVMDSRSLRFVDEVQEITGGEGVDVVLNSLGGDFLINSLKLLRRHGRFLELGKRDILRDTGLGLGAFAKCISFFAVDIGPDLPGFGAMWRELAGHLNAGSFGSLPCQAFPAATPRDAFEHMAKALHIGKVVLSFTDRAAVSAAANNAPLELPWEDLVRSDGAVLAAGRIHKPLLAPAIPWEHAHASDSGKHARPNLKTAFRAPESATEQSLAIIWENLLGITPIGTEDDFFDLKGDSLLAAQVMSRLHQAFTVRLPLSLIFEHPTVRAIAAQIDQRLGPAAEVNAAVAGEFEEGVV